MNGMWKINWSWESSMEQTTIILLLLFLRLKTAQNLSSESFTNNGSSVILRGKKNCSNLPLPRLVFVTRRVLSFKGGV